MCCKKIIILIFIFSVIGCSNTNVGRSPAGISSFFKLSSKKCVDILQNITNQKIVFPTKQLTRINSELNSFIKGQDFNKLKIYDAEIKLLDGSRKSLLAKIHAIRNAKYSIHLTTFIFSDDTVSRIILHELKKALKRGVEVKMLIDSWGSTAASGNLLNQRFKALTQIKGGWVRSPDGDSITRKRARAQVATFNDLGLVHTYVKNWYTRLKNLFLPVDKQIAVHKYDLNRRLHDKILMIDGKSHKDSKIFMGGRNISDAYYGLEKKASKNFLDLEIMITNSKGSAPSEDFSLSETLSQYIDQLYFHLGNKFLERAILKLNRFEFKRELRKFYKGNRRLTNDLEEQLTLFQKEWEQEKSYLGSIQFVHKIFNSISSNSTGIIRNKNSIDAIFRKELFKFDGPIRIVGPYLNPSSVDVLVMKNWLYRNSQNTLEIFVPSFLSNDMPVVQGALDNIFIPRLITQLKKFVNNGQVKIFAYADIKEFKDDKIRLYHKRLHTKLATFGNNKALITSHNFNWRSRTLDTESGLVLKKFDSDQNENIVDDINLYVDTLQSKSIPWGGKDWKELYNKEEYKRIVTLQKFLARFIEIFGLENST
jgi:cardiolipin synthase C